MADVQLIPTAAPRMDGIPAGPVTMPLPMGDSGFAAWPGMGLVLPGGATAAPVARPAAPSGDALARWMAGQAGISQEFTAAPGSEPALEMLAASLPQLPQVAEAAIGPDGPAPAMDDAPVADAEAPQPEAIVGEAAIVPLSATPAATPAIPAPQAPAATDEPQPTVRPMGGATERQATAPVDGFVAMEPEAAAPPQAGTVTAPAATPPARRTEPPKTAPKPDLPIQDAAMSKTTPAASDRVAQAPTGPLAAMTGSDSPAVARNAELPAGLADSMTAMAHGLEGGHDLSLHGPARATTTGPAGAAVHHDPRPVMQQVAEAVVTARGDRTEIALSPEELGRLRLVMTGADRGQITIWAERPETLDLIRRNADLLTQQLADAGITAGTLDFRQDERMARPDQTWRRADGETGDSLPDGPALPAVAAVRLSQTPLSDRRIDIRL